MGLLCAVMRVSGEIGRISAANSRERQRQLNAAYRERQRQVNAERRLWIAQLIEYARSQGFTVTRVDLEHCVVKVRGASAGTVMTWNEAKAVVMKGVK